jgi:hypothetical protein
VFSGKNLIPPPALATRLAPTPHLRCQAQKASSDIDENLDSVSIVVPVTPMTIMLNKRVMLMVFVEPAVVVMIIG